MTCQTNRRQFLQAGAAAGLGFWVAGTSPAADKKERSSLERLRFACVGVGGKGSSDTDHAGRLGDIVALCDIDDNTLNGKANQYKSAKKFNDFREMLAKLGDGIDAVVISTPDHTHAAAAAMAIRMGKHVYVQKPLTHTVHEARTLRQLARQHKVCSQMGNQGTALDQFRSSVELLRSGALGKVKEVHVWTNRPIWPQAPGVTKRPAPGKAPAHVHWDLFLGPAPERPYAGGYHPFNWRGWQDFGTGALGDMACHTANMPFMGLKLGHPTTIQAENEPLNDETYPGWAKVVYSFPQRGDFAPCTLTWYEGKRDGKRVLPSIDLLQGREKDYSGSGCLIVAENATVYSPDDYGATLVMIGKGAADLKRPAKKLSRRGGDNDLEQKKEWVEAIKKNDARHALGNFDYSALLTEVVLLGNVAMKAGTKLTYDGKSGKFSEPDHDKLLHHPYRSGWKL
ncbi:MAG: Gfo/Idh/MocA family oxidoreductase [Gemmataceae bacterium]